MHRLLACAKSVWRFSKSCKMMHIPKRTQRFCTWISFVWPHKMSHFTTTIDKNKSSKKKKITNRRLGLKKIALWTVLALHISCTCKITLLTKIVCLWYLVLCFDAFPFVFVQDPCYRFSNAQPQQNIRKMLTVSIVFHLCSKEISKMKWQSPTTPPPWFWRWKFMSALV